MGCTLNVNSDNAKSRSSLAKYDGVLGNYCTFLVSKADTLCIYLGFIRYLFRVLNNINHDGRDGNVHPQQPIVIYASFGDIECLGDTLAVAWMYRLPVARVFVLR